MLYYTDGMLIYTLEVWEAILLFENTLLFSLGDEATCFVIAFQ